MRLIAEKFQWQKFIPLGTGISPRAGEEHTIMQRNFTNISNLHFTFTFASKTGCKNGE